MASSCLSAKTFVDNSLISWSWQSNRLTTFPSWDRFVFLLCLLDEFFHFFDVFCGHLCYLAANLALTLGMNWSILFKVIEDVDDSLVTGRWFGFHHTSPCYLSLVNGFMTGNKKFDYQNSVLNGIFRHLEIGHLKKEIYQRFKVIRVCLLYSSTRSQSYAMFTEGATFIYYIIILFPMINEVNNMLLMCIIYAVYILTFKVFDKSIEDHI